MPRQIKITNDGSHTIEIPESNLAYHSKHGAIAESIHVFIEAGLLPLSATHKKLTILEIGFGTGLNALLAMREAIRQNKSIKYIAVEPYPLTTGELQQLNHGELLQMQEIFLQLHTAEWEKTVALNALFSIEKIKTTVAELKIAQPIDCIFFDAFAPTDQPELWTQDVFEKLYSYLEKDGVLVTYSSKSIIRKAMVAAGFLVEKIPGPHGKRDMVRAKKL